MYTWIQIQCCNSRIIACALTNISKSSVCQACGCYTCACVPKSNRMRTQIVRLRPVRKITASCARITHLQLFTSDMSSDIHIKLNLCMKVTICLASCVHARILALCSYFWGEALGHACMYRSTCAEDFCRWCRAQRLPQACDLNDRTKLCIVEATHAYIHDAS